MYPGQHGVDIPTKPAYIMAESGQVVTHAQLNDRSNQAAHLFRSLGLLPGDGIVILLDNHVCFLQIAWAAQRTGLYYTPISILFQSDEISYIIRNSDAKLVITSTQFLPKITQESAPGISVLLVDGDVDGCISWQTEVARQPTHPVPDECEGAEMLYSSGTTGYPKGVRFPIKGETMGSVSELFRKRTELHQVSGEARYLSTAPLYHSAPLRYNMMMNRLGASAVIMHKFDPEKALQLIETHRITHSQWVPTMFIRLLQLPISVRNRYDLSSHRIAIHAAAPCPVAVKERMLEWWGPIIYEYYSATEANGQTAISPQEWYAHPGSVGRAILGEIHILNDTGDDLPAGEIGTVYFAKGADFQYYKDPEKTAAAKTHLGWSTMGDVGYLDEDGYLYLRDRRSFVIISGGVNVYPQEVEHVLIDHPKVSDVAVFGIPDEEFGEQVKAVVELIDPNDAGKETERELIDYCRSKIAHLKCPRTVDFESLPRHPNGKLYKRVLKDRYWRQHRSKII
jgi:acyl-CoA synthetase (AMP-forming)/AMP-acid ligase II|tara:strand:- start:6698 stop:8227 length:1530 start_codon:yes stop_codon:yes gene_type:complete